MLPEPACPSHGKNRSRMIAARAIKPATAAWQSTAFVPMTRRKDDFFEVGRLEEKTYLYF